LADFPDIGVLAAAIAGRAARPPVGARAAVMVCLRDRGSGPEVLVGRRQVREGDPWSGQMALPGGRLDHADETPLDAAVRETIEEVGFDPLAHGRLLGPLEPVAGGARRLVVAVFAAEIVSTVEPAPSDELQAAWWAPFAALTERLVRVPEVPYEVPALVGDGGDGREAIVWGMTYRILTSARALDR
jgi:8-oxo-dGTP pyrophosphatase MutT (NUDIX family)